MRVFVALDTQLSVSSYRIFGIIPVFRFFLRMRRQTIQDNFLSITTLELLVKRNHAIFSDRAINIVN